MSRGDKKDCPTEIDLKDRITRQLSWNSSAKENVALIWRGYLAGLLEWGLIEVSVFDRLIALLPQVGNPELYELSLDEQFKVEDKNH